MGGTFDPIHYGHLVVAETAGERFRLDRVFFVPAGDPYFKSGVSGASDRYNMTVLALGGNPRFEASRMEIDRSGPSYTVDTLEEFKKEYPGAAVYLIIGADVLPQISKWREPKRIFGLCEIIAVNRPGYERDFVFPGAGLSGVSPRIHYIDIPSLDISATRIREQIKKGQTVKYLLPEPVENYILKAELYKEGVPEPFDFAAAREKLRLALSVKRFRHTLGVAETAVRLAAIHGDVGLVEKARIAALLHDCAKDYHRELALGLCEEYSVKLDPVMLANGRLIHSFLGAEIAERQYGVTDPDILNAIRYHTTGHENMSLLEKIIFVADYTEPGRKGYGGIAKARDIARENLDMSVEFILGEKINYVSSGAEAVHPLSARALAYYRKLNKGVNRG